MGIQVSLVETEYLEKMKVAVFLLLTALLTLAGEVVCEIPTL